MDSTKSFTSQSICEEFNFNTTFNKHSKAIFNFLVFNYHDKQLAEDAVQEAYITLWKNCSKVPLEKAKSYLYTIAKNKIIDAFRNKQTVNKYANNNVSNTVEQETPMFILEEKEFHKTLNQALAKMPEKYRVPFLLNRIEKKKYKEIAELLDTTVKAIEKRIYNALEFLQEELEISKKRF